MGTSIARRYVVMGPLGRGGVCEVYHAVDVVDRRASAIKLVAPALAEDERVREMVRREAAMTDRLRHPSVPKLYGVGEARLPGGAVVPYLVLELLKGVPLAGRLASGPLPPLQALRIAATVADVLAVAHRRGVVHRDLNPMNIMMTPTGIKIIDFGLAVEALASGSGQAEDVYALGVLLYQMLTGRSPYPRSSPAAALASVRQPSPAPTPVLLVPGLPRAVADLCRSCMAKRPADRPDSATVALALWSALTRPRPDPQAGGGPGQKLAETNGNRRGNIARSSRAASSGIAPSPRMTTSAGSRTP
jgi:serine/threonine protein kinase